MSTHNVCFCREMKMSIVLVKMAYLDLRIKVYILHTCA